ncbi:MAG: hypothetical protein IPH93_07835 [Saprospiraceae bacterium]|nr:hypothetical protein [Saprospiraceae bacterium]
MIPICEDEEEEFLTDATDLHRYIPSHLCQSVEFVRKTIYSRMSTDC